MMETMLIEVDSKNGHMLFPSLILGQVCDLLNQWEFSKCDACKVLKNTCAFDLALSCCFWELCNNYHVGKPELACWKMRNHGLDTPVTLADIACQ